MTNKSTGAVASVCGGGALGFCRLLWPAVCALRALRFFGGILGQIVEVSVVVGEARGHDRLRGTLAS